MIPLIAGLGAAMAGSVGSTLLGHSLGQSSAKQQQRAQIEAYKNRHTWEVSDLRNAGLNPILSAQGGGSVGGMAQAAVPQSDLGESLGRGAQAALAAATAQQVQAQTDLTRAQAAKVDVERHAVATSAHGQAINNEIQSRELDAINRDPDAFWRTKYQGPLMRKIEDVGSSAKRIYDNIRAKPAHALPLPEAHRR